MEITHTIRDIDGYHQAEITIINDDEVFWVVLGLDGWDIDEYDSRVPKNRFGQSSRGKNVRLSGGRASGLKLTWMEWRAVVEYIDKIYLELQTLHSGD